ncbi:carbohydrate esterase family 16 protein [Trichoderma sp. SZMC 28013]
MMRSILLVSSFVAALNAASLHPKSDFKYLVTFGDSYTDNGRLNYYGSHQAHGPPPGVLPTETNVTASGGLTWPQYVRSNTGATLYDYAISGATCDNNNVARWAGFLNANFPSIITDEIPSFKKDRKTALYRGVTAANTVYALWIGTNDLSYTGILSDSQVAGTNITTYTNCLWSTFDAIYATGGRRFVLLNLNALQLVGLYRPQSDGGAGDNQFWQNKTLYNQTEYAQKILEYTTSANTIIDYGVPFHLLVKNRWPGAKVAVFDIHSFITEIYNTPKNFLEPPHNVKGFFHHCDVNGANCVDGPGSLDSYLWYDELHPSNKTDSLIAHEFVQVVSGHSKFGTYWGH